MSPSLGKKSLESCASLCPVGKWQRPLGMAPWCIRKAKPGRAHSSMPPGALLGRAGDRAPEMTGIGFLHLEGWRHREGFKIILNKIKKVVFLAQMNLCTKIHAHHRHRRGVGTCSILNFYLLPLVGVWPGGLRGWA